MNSFTDFVLKRKINILTVSQKTPTYEHDFEELLFPAADMKSPNNENLIHALLVEVFARAVLKIRLCNTFSVVYP